MTLSAAYLYLGIAIIVEVVATTALKASDSFTRLWPSLLTIAGYGVSFYLLSMSLRVLPTGIAYAVWSGAGIVLISAVSWLWYRQSLDLPALLGIGLIVAGVIVINVFSGSVSH